jgi:hypothetical protein
MSTSEYYRDTRGVPWGTVGTKGVLGVLRGYYGVRGVPRGTLGVPSSRHRGPARTFGTHVARRIRAVFIARPTTGGRPHGHVCVLCHRPVSRASAAGVTWTSRTASAPWGARADHTSVIDAAGAIYVIGGLGDGGGFQDVWVSTDGGA